MKNFEHINAGSFAEATKELKSAGYAQPIAGGTDLVGTLKQGTFPNSPIWWST